jgi:hypothetical protein
MVEHSAIVSEERDAAAASVARADSHCAAERGSTRRAPCSRPLERWLLRILEPFEKITETCELMRLVLLAREMRARSCGELGPVNDSRLILLNFKIDNVALMCEHNIMWPTSPVKLQLLWPIAVLEWAGSSGHEGLDDCNSSGIVA